MSDGESEERESALKDDVMGVVEGRSTTTITVLHCSKGCELWQVYPSPYSLFLLFMIIVASA